MFQEKFRKGIASLLIVCMTIGSNGFATLADSSEGAIAAAGQAGSQENTTNYYYEYQQELVMNVGKSQDSLNSFGDAGDAANADNFEDKENIDLDGEGEQTTTVPTSKADDADNDGNEGNGGSITNASSNENGGEGELVFPDGRTMHIRPRETVRSALVCGREDGSGT